MPQLANLATCLVCILPITSLAASEQISCPATLEVKTSATPPTGWQLVPATGNTLLERVGFYSGPPSEQASLVPDSTKNSKDEVRDIWTFVPNEKETIWVNCFYLGTTLTLAKPLRKGSKRCEVRYKTSKSGTRLQLLGVQCE
jgi:hypothetical protein